MRPFCSITATLSLILAAVVSQWAMPCCQASRQKICHRAAEHHCGHMHEVESDEQPDTYISAAAVPVKCPMTCCFSVVPNAATSEALVTIHLQTGSDAAVQVSYIAFSTSGFSSHTDRGPPLV